MSSVCRLCWALPHLGPLHPRARPGVQQGSTVQFAKNGLRFLPSISKIPAQKELLKVGRDPTVPHGGQKPPWLYWEMVTQHLRGHQALRVGSSDHQLRS